MAPPAEYLRLRKQTVLLYSLVLLAAFVFTISSFSVVVPSAISVSSESLSQSHSHDGNDDRQPLRMGRRSLLEETEDDESDDLESLVLLKKKRGEQSSTSSTTKLTKSPPSSSSPSKFSKNQTKLIKPSSSSSSSSGLSSSSLSKSKSNKTKLVKPTNLESEEDETSIYKKTTKLQRLNPTSSSSKESDSKTQKSSPSTKKSSSDLFKTSSSSKNTKSQSDIKKKQSNNKLKDSSSDKTKSKKNNGKPSSSTSSSSSSSEKKTSTTSKSQQTSAQKPKKQAPPTYWLFQDDEDDFVSEFRGLPTKFHKTFVPDLHRISTTSKLYLSKTTKQMTTNFKPYVGNKYASTAATVVSFSFILLPLLLVSLLFNRIIQSYSSLQKILIFIQVYLSIYFTILSLSSLVTGLEPLKFFYATSQSTYVWLQVLQTLAYVFYLLLLFMYLILVFGTESGLGSKFLGLAQTFVGFAVGLHYYVAVFHKVVLHQPPKTNWKVHGIYALSFLLISFCAGADRRKKAYLNQDGGDEEGKKS